MLCNFDTSLLKQCTRYENCMDVILSQCNTYISKHKYRMIKNSYPFLFLRQLQYFTVILTI